LIYTLDTNTVSAVLRGEPHVLTKLASTVTEGNAITLNAVSYFEVRRGLHLPLFKQKLHRFLSFAQACDLLPLNLAALDAAAAVYQRLRQQGSILENADILIAATALSHDAILVTRNLKHFGRIEGLRLESLVLKFQEA
jgi:tRNA(fMet)-specific endonuclease VapC